MNRREALAALTALPGIGAITRASLKPSDVIVIEVPGNVTEEQARRIKECLQFVWPNHRSVVLTNGMQLKVVRGEE